MARSIAQIRLSIINSLVSTAAAVGITINPSLWVLVPGSLSKTDYKLLLLNAMVDAQSTEEQLNDSFIEDVEAIIPNLPPQTSAWFQNQMLNVFQFNSGTPQLPLITPPNFVPTFNPIVLAYQVIKFCSVIYGSSGRCLIKVAADDGTGAPGDLDTYTSAGALAAAQSFVNDCSAPGISYVVSSGNADQLFAQIDVFFNGIYSSVIFANIQTAIVNFLKTQTLTNPTGIPFNGVIKISLLEEAILAVPGVNDVVFVNLGARQDSVSFSTAYALGFNLVNSNTEINKSWSTIAGYCKLETTSGKTLSDFRTGSSGPLNLNCIAQ